MRLHTALACVAALFTAVSLFNHTVAARLLLLAAGIALAGIALGRDRELRGLPPIWIPFALWAGWAALSIAWSIEPERSLKEWRNEVFYTGAGLWICYVGAQARRAPQIFLAILGAATLAVCLTAIAYFLRGYATHFHTGPHGGPGNFSSTVLTLMPCALVACVYAYLVRWRWWVIAGAGGCVLLLLAGAYTTLNRTVWIGLAVEIALLVALVVRRLGLPAARARQIVGGITLACLIGAVALVLSIQAARESFGVRPLVQDSRLLLWPEVIERAAERPLAGYGFGRGLLRGSLQEELRGVDTQLWHAHNIFLEQLVQTGLPGMLLFIAVLAAIVRAGWRLARGPDPAAAACGMALLGVLTGMLMRNMTDTLLVRQNALLFWAVTGILLGLAARPWRA